jgi:hypothetical protein
MEIKAPFFRLTIVDLLMTAFLAFFTVVSKLAFSVTENRSQNRRVSIKDSPVPNEAWRSRLSKSSLNSECGFAEMKWKTKQTRQVDFALQCSKSTCGEDR